MGWTSRDDNHQILTLYVVPTRPWHERESLYSITSGHVIVRRLHPGDVIVARVVVVWDAWRRPEDDGPRAHLRIDAANRDPMTGRDFVAVCERHPGRRPMLGEDTLDGAFGGDALLELAEEAVGVHADHHWYYAPVEYMEGDPDAHNEGIRGYHYTLGTRLEDDVEVRYWALRTGSAHNAHNEEMT